MALKLTKHLLKLQLNLMAVPTSLIKQSANSNLILTVKQSFSQRYIRQVMRQIKIYWQFSAVYFKAYYR